jgi:hypothetical protein
MSRTAEDVSASLSSDGPTLDPTDAIADLLIGDNKSELDEVKDEETPIQTSNQDDDEESNEEQKADDDSEGEEEGTLEEIAEGDVTWEGVLGVSEDSLSFDEAGNVAGFKTKVNGEEQIVSAADLVAGYQNNKSFTGKSQAHAEVVKDFEVQKERVQQVYASKLESVNALSKHFEKQLIAEFDDVNWTQLRVENPAEYAALRQDYAAKASELQGIQEAINKDKESVNKQTSEDNLAKQQTYMQSQYDQMLVNNPEWSDEKTRDTARDGFKAFVKDSYGFTDGEWDSVFDARLIELVKDAKKYHDGAAVAGKKTLKPVPKFQKSRGKGVKRQASKLEKLTAASKKATGGQKRDLQQSAVAELLLGG